MEFHIAFCRFQSLTARQPQILEKNPTIDTLLRVFDVLGMELEDVIRDAAIEPDVASSIQLWFRGNAKGPSVPEKNWAPYWRNKNASRSGSNKDSTKKVRTLSSSSFGKL